MFHYSCNGIIASHFEVVNPSDVKHAAKLFPVPDFVSDACKTIASHERGAVAGIQNGWINIYIALSNII